MLDLYGNLIPQRLDIPDYDPTLDRYRRRWAAPVFPEVWPDVRRLAPYRWIVSREEVKEDGRIVYHNEHLECGHVRQEFVGGNLSSKRRRCRKCLYPDRSSAIVAHLACGNGAG